MLFAALCQDKTNAFDLRAELRPQHFAWLSGLGPRVKIAGPFLDGQGRMTGSLVVVDAKDEDDAKVLFASDPYALGGLFSNVEIRAWRWVVGEPK